MMTREEVKKELETQRRSLESLLDSLLPSEREGSLGVKDTIEIFTVAIDAIDKSIPKKPYLWGDGYADGHLVYDMWDCPNCEKTYEVDYDEYDHCPACGQAIDWSEEE